MDKTTLKFGRWPSKVSAEFVAGKALRFQTVQALGDTLYWTEGRPLENGRMVLVCAGPGLPPTDLLEAPYSAKTKVHEYGGNAFLATPKTLYFINGDDQQIWSLDNPAGEKHSKPTASPHKITSNDRWRFADLVLDERRNRLICVAETRDKAKKHPNNLLVTVSLDPVSEPQIAPLITGDDFYASPRLSPSGRQLAFVSWNLPFMPWESARLQIADLDEDGAPTTLQTPNSSHDGASFQPEWNDEGHLWFINDDTGFGQLYRYDGKDITLTPQNGAELGDPLWVFGMKSYGFLEDGRIASRSLIQGKAALCLIDHTNQEVRTCPGTDNAPGQSAICALDQLVTLKNEIAGIVSRSDEPDAIAMISSKTGKQTTLRTSAEFDLPQDEISVAQTLTFKNELGQIVYGNYYPPTNQAFEGPMDELPPVICAAHGGPTAFSHAGLKPKIQYWTSRGFGYFDVNYSGSWGFGKAYRQRLDGQWGCRDVADMVAGARHLVETGLADPQRLLISGSSAGGYTVLMTLASSNIFAAGASYYGISDLARLCESTHKFEAGYTDRLLGLSPENKKNRLKARSPLLMADKITAPVIFFQGLQDKVVPPEQAELMVRALEEKGLDVRYKTFLEEGHGFRSSQTIETALTMEYEFYAKVLGI